MKGTVSRGRKVRGVLLSVATYVAVGVVCAVPLGLVGCILYRGIPNVSWELLTESPSLLRGTVGVLPNLLNTLYVVLATLLTVLPLGVGSAVYLSEYAHGKRSVRVVELAIETLSGIPSIVYGLVGMLVFVQYCTLGTSILAGALTLSVMVLPTVVRTTQESLKSVPDSYREGSLALGAGRWYTVRRVVLPSALDGIVTGTILAVGRIVGESAALLFTAGMANEALTLWEAYAPNGSGATLAVSLYVYAKERGDLDTAFAIAVVLLVLSCVMNLSARLATRLLRSKKRERTIDYGSSV